MKMISSFTLAAIAAFAIGCGAAPGATEDGLVADPQAATGANDALTGVLSVSAGGSVPGPTAAVSVGSPVTVVQTATNTSSSVMGPVVIGITRLGFAVADVVAPATGKCRIAGAVSCNFVQLAPGETQSLEVTLVPRVPGSYTINGWTRSSYFAGGSLARATVTVP